MITQVISRPMENRRTCNISCKDTHVVAQLAIYDLSISKLVSK